ncbi:uncharacterized protein [Ptychodera flava]|uniref:uncharacterized protein n=1 Tax=Ptychodera flava TaxID=63121 RepID=UPI003969E1FD
MAEKVDPLRRLFLEISQRISSKEEGFLYGLVKDKQIPTKALEGLADGNELFIKLEELGCIGNENLTLLKELLGSIKLEPLVRLVEEFERKQQKNQSISQQHDVNKDFDEFQREPIVHLVEESETRQHGSQSVSQQAEHGNQSVGQQDGLDTDLDEFQQEPVVQSVEESETIQHGSQSISQQHRNQNVGQQDGLTTESPGISTQLMSINPFPLVAGDKVGIKYKSGFHSVKLQCQGSKTQNGYNMQN